MIQRTAFILACSLLLMLTGCRSQKINNASPNTTTVPTAVPTTVPEITQSTQGDPTTASGNAPIDATKETASPESAEKNTASGNTSNSKGSSADRNSNSGTGKNSGSNDSSGIGNTKSAKNAK